MPPPEGSKRDATYYFDDGDVVFVFEKVLFKVHGTFLKHFSEIFRDMLEVPQGHNKDKDGSESNPIQLEQVKADEFRDICRVMYHGLSRGNSIGKVLTDVSP
ncbi:hypothetical protein BD410DRAFT_845022 [Rickenella mellea]|uniref:BTB domain-containing protein n=1 Tax=Rickenella mellea TaxID=50990 RepID=A0A4Y7PJJ7_9AGAM|nr:hypothetical protein BD410DRAFT_845022 [Rickenella mellea]